MENITDADGKHVCRVLKDFRVQKIYHDIYLQSDRLLLADVFESFFNKCIEIYEFDPAYIFRTKISIVAMPKEKRIKMGLFKDVDMLLIVENGIRDRMCHAIHGYVQANNKKWTFMNQKNESSYLMNWNVKKLHGVTT